MKRKPRVASPTPATTLHLVGSAVGLTRAVKLREKSIPSLWIRYRFFRAIFDAIIFAVQTYVTFQFQKLLPAPTLRNVWQSSVSLSLLQTSEIMGKTQIGPAVVTPNVDLRQVTVQHPPVKEQYCFTLVHELDPSPNLSNYNCHIIFWPYFSKVLRFGTRASVSTQV